MGKTEKLGIKRKNLFLYSETWLIVGLVTVLTTTSTLLFIGLFSYLRLPFAWLALGLTIFITRKSYAFKMGIAFYNLAAFLSGYVFGMWFSLSVILVALYFTAKARPEQLQGLIVNFVLLNIVAGVSAIVSSVYGLGITQGQFIAIALIIVLFGIVIDFLFAARFTGAAKPRLLFSHCLELFVNYYVIANFGYIVFKVLVGVA